MPSSEETTVGLAVFGAVAAFLALLRADREARTAEALGVARRMARRYHDADEAESVAFAAVAQADKTWAPSRGPWEPWVILHVRAALRVWVAAERRQRDVVPLLPPPNSQLSPEDLSRAVVDDLLASLDGRHAALVRRVVMEGVPTAVVARELGVTPRRVTMLLAEGLTNLRRALA